MIYITKGEAKAIPFQIKNDSGGVVDVTSLDIEFIAKEDSSSSTAQIQKRNTSGGGSDSEVKVINGSLGLCVVYLGSSDTAALTEDTLYHCYIKAGSYVNEYKIKTTKGEVSGSVSYTTGSSGTYSVLYCEYGEDVTVLDNNNLTVTGSWSGGTLTLVSSGFVEGKTKISSTLESYYGWDFSGDDIEIDFGDQWVSGAKTTIIVSVYS